MFSFWRSKSKPAHGSLDIGDCLIRPEGLVIAVCDEASTFNRPTICREAWASTTPNPDPAKDMRLFEFNTYLHKEMNAERALSWILVLWGIFRVRVRLHDHVSNLPFRAVSETFIAHASEAVLDLPTGRIGWLDIELAESKAWTLIATVPPGRYLCRLTGAENGDHWDLENESDYPPGDEDWVLHLAPMPADAQKARRRPASPDPD